MNPYGSSLTLNASTAVLAFAGTCMIVATAVGVPSIPWGIVGGLGAFLVEMA